MRWRWHVPKEQAALEAALRRRGKNRGIGWEWPDWETLVGFFKELLLLVATVAALFIALVWVSLLGGGAAWRTLMVGVWFTLEAGFLGHRTALKHHPDGMTLAFLPVAGARIGRWLRWRVISRSWKVLMKAGVAAWIVHDPEVGPRSPVLDEMPMIAVQGVGLWLMTLSTTVLLYHPVVRRLKLDWWWSTGASVLLLGSVLACPLLAAKLGAGSLAKLMSTMAPWLAWTFPPAWLGPSSLTAVDVSLALLWIGLGVRAWVKWPVITGAMLDRPQDFLGDQVASRGRKAEATQAASGAGSTGEESEERSPVDKAALAVALREEARSVQEAFAPEARGWIERLVWRVLDERGRRLAPLLLERKPGWSRQWRRGLLMGATGVLAACLTRFLPESRSHDFNGLLWLVQIMALLFCIEPEARRVPQVFLPASFAVLSSSKHILLPVTVREIWWMNQRVTLVIALAALPLTIALCVANALALGEGMPAILLSCAFAVGALTFVVLVRPLVVMSKLEEGTRWVWWHWLLNVVILGPIALVGLLAGFAGLTALVSSAGFMLMSSKGYAPGWRGPLMAGSFFLIQWVANWSLFALYVQDVRRARVDFLRRVAKK